mmetsp:Transcript_21093/g.18704  ORF Transcript_21093/g.18704 Transcript_21093/m.18704 type:complete len:97 (+) Transcript_21093:231-521(+)
MKNDSFINFDISQSSGGKNESYKIAKADEESSMFISNNETKEITKELNHLNISEDEGEGEEIEAVLTPQNEDINSILSLSSHKEQSHEVSAENHEN